MSCIEFPIEDLQIREVLNRPGTPPSRVDNAIEQELISLHAPVDQELNGEEQFPSVEVSESRDSEIKQPGKPGQIKETGNQFFVASNKNNLIRTDLA